MLVYLKCKNRKIPTQKFTVSSVERRSSCIVLHSAWSLATGKHYDVLEFSTEDWKTI